MFSALPGQSFSTAVSLSLGPALAGVLPMSSDFPAASSYFAVVSMCRGCSIGAAFAALLASSFCCSEANCCSSFLSLSRSSSSVSVGFLDRCSSCNCSFFLRYVAIALGTASRFPAVLCL